MRVRINGDEEAGRGGRQGSVPAMGGPDSGLSKGSPPEGKVVRSVRTPGRRQGGRDYEGVDPGKFPAVSALGRTGGVGASLSLSLVPWWESDSVCRRWVCLACSAAMEVPE